MILEKVEAKRKGKKTEILSVGLDGKIRFSKGLCDLVKIEPKMRVDFFQDTSETENNWFIHFSQKGTYELRSFENENCIIYNKAMAEKIRKHFCYQNIKPMQLKLSDAIQHEDKTYYQLMFIG